MSAVLAQFNLIEEANIPPLPAPPPLERFLLENPIPGVILLVVLAIALFFLLNARGRIRTAAITSGVLLVLAGALFGLASLVETDREAIAARTRDLVSAVAAADQPAMERILAPDLSVRATRVPRGAARDEVIATVESVLGGTYRVSEHEILDLQAALYGPRVGRTQTRVRVTSEFGSIPSWWRVDWQLHDDNEWRANRIEALWIPGVPNPGG